MSAVIFDKKKLTRLKRTYAVAVTAGKGSFFFDGHELLVVYAKCLIEYLSKRFTAKGAP